VSRIKPAKGAIAYNSSGSDYFLGVPLRLYRSRKIPPRKPRAADRSNDDHAIKMIKMPGRVFGADSAALHRSPCLKVRESIYVRPCGKIPIRMTRA
jgi:hypothetical protein